MSGAEEDEGFLARWSRLKRAARGGAAEPATPEVGEAARRTEQAAGEGAAAAAATPGRAAPSPAAEPAEEPVDLAALPKVEELAPGADLSVFFRKGVPAALRQAALRRMWSIDPAIRDFIGPADYAWDWNAPGGVPDYVAEVAETPAIRDLVQRLLAPARPPAAARQDRPAEAAAEEAPLPAPGPATAALPPADPRPAPTAAEGEGEAPPPPLPAEHDGRDRAAPTAPPPVARPRHGGALPV